MRCLCEKTPPSLPVRKKARRHKTQLCVLRRSPESQQYRQTGTQRSGAGRTSRSTCPSSFTFSIVTSGVSKIIIQPYAFLKRDLFMKVRRYRRKHVRARKEAAPDRGGCSVSLCGWVTSFLISSWQYSWKYDWSGFTAQPVCVNLWFLGRKTQKYFKMCYVFFFWKTLHRDTRDCPTLSLTHMIYILYHIQRTSLWIFLHD